MIPIVAAVIHIVVRKQARTCPTWGKRQIAARRRDKEAVACEHCGARIRPAKTPGKG